MGSTGLTFRRCEVGITRRFDSSPFFSKIGLDNCWRSSGVSRGRWFGLSPFRFPTLRNVRSFDFFLATPEEGREILERAGLAIIESDLIGVELPAGPQPLLSVCTALLQAEVNIVQAYPLILRPHGRAAVALMVDNIEMGLETLGEKGFTMLTEDDLINGEPFGSE